MQDLVIPTMTMSSREIADLTGKEHKNVLADIRKMLEDLGHTSAEFSADLPDAYGRMQTAFKLPKRETLILISGYSTKLRAKIVDRWQELEAAQMVAPHPVVSLPAPMVEAMQFAEVAARMLNLQGSARLGMARKVAGIMAPHLLPVFPVYAIDAPAGSATGSSEPTAPLTTLLKEHGVWCSTANANLILEELGLLEAQYRKTSSGTSSKFWAITPYGSKYGKNVMHPQRQLETQPHWFRSQAADLIQLITDNL